MRAWKQIGGGALLGCALTLLGLSAGRTVPDEDRVPNKDTFATTLGPVRLTEGRVDGQVLYAPYPSPPPRHAGPLLSQRQRELIDSKASYLVGAWRRDRAFSLLLGNHLDAAILDLESATPEVSAKAYLLADLSALYGERARAKDRPEDYLAALELAERAESSDPNLVEAVFNRALGLEHLFLFDAARAGWLHYLQIDPSTPWADEARAHIKRIPAIERDSVVDQRALELIAEANKVAGSMDLLGKPVEAWRYRLRALALGSRMPQSSASLATLEDASLALLAQRRPHAALEFESRALHAAEIFHGPEKVVTLLMGRARIEAAIGRQEEAKQDFSRALEVMHTVQGARERLAALIDVVQQEINDDEDRAAIIALQRQVPGQLTARADYEFRRGDAVAAESQLWHALDAFERQRADVALRSDRVSFFEQAQPLYMRMVALQLHLAQPEKALEVLERFRARTLLDQMRGEKLTTPLSWRDISRRLPLRTKILVYAVIEGRLITWIVQPSGISVSIHQPDWTTVLMAVQSLLIAQHEGQAATRAQLLEQIYRELVEPVSREISADDRVIFVPTRLLYRVPFAALRAPGSGRFLVQDHEVGVAPSVSEFLAAVERDRRISAQPIAKVLLVGDPTMDRRAAMQLPSLPGTEKEIASLGRIYRGLDVRVLTRRTATPSQVLDSIAGYDVAHLAVHGQQDREDPARSHLVLSSGELSVQDILGTRLARMRLVVLAACDTQAGPISESEGSLSLAHAFLAAGAPAVVGSLWHVTDDSTERLSVRFHQELLRGADALSALRTAQLAEISARPGSTDWTWASFQVLGGVEARMPR